MRGRTKGKDWSAPGQPNGHSARIANRITSQTADGSGVQMIDLQTSDLATHDEHSHQGPITGDAYHNTSSDNTDEATRLSGTT